ncbi:myelin-associated glycoprotein-like isoform X1 [Ascaphus truei]|uniref:myelin-associated glycoprotein-like isoform X1 n=1 Tax=Ascaphus truei TaxID=8439 RepID=UPI003F592989
MFQDVLTILLLLQGVLPFTMSTRWDAIIPKHLSTVKKSCVVIPCLFSYPGSVKTGTNFAALWFQVAEDRYPKETLFFHSENRLYQKRASLVGDMYIKNCSLWIRNVGGNDATTYQFHVEIEGYQNYSYPSVVKLEVKDTPPGPDLQATTWEIAEGKEVTLTCRTNHTCPMNPPSLEWSVSLGFEQKDHLEMRDGIWQVVSSQTFTASRLHQGMSFTCTEKHDGGANSQRTGGHLNIVYKPDITPESHCRLNLNGVECQCVVHANPPASIIWRLPERNITQSGEGFVLNSSSTGHVTQSILKGSVPSMGEVWCYSINEEGTAGMALPLYLDVTMYLLIFGASAGVLGLGVTVALIVCRYRRTSTGSPDTKDCSVYKDPKKKTIVNSVYGLGMEELHSHVSPNAAHTSGTEEMYANFPCRPMMHKVELSSAEPAGSGYQSVFPPPEPDSIYANF